MSHITAVARRVFRCFFNDLHDELVLFTRADMQPLEALQAATINATKCLHLADSIGSVEKGQIADIIILNENHLRHIHNTKKIFAVILNGRYLSRATLDKMLKKPGGKAQQVNNLQPY